MATGSINSPLTELIAAGGMQIVPLGVIGPSPNHGRRLVFSENVRALLVVISGTAAQCGLYTIYGGYQSTTSSRAFSSSNTVTVTGHASTDTTNRGKIEITSTAALRGYILMIEGNGGFTAEEYG